MLWLAVIAIGTVGAAAATIWILPRRHAWRWGTVRGPAALAGKGPYREGSTEPDVLRGVPGIVRWSAGLGVAWGVLTLVVFAPGGCFFLLVVVDHQAGLAALLIPLLTIVLCDALVLGIALAAVAPVLLRGGEEGARAARKVSRWSTAHHFAVLVVFALAPVASRAGGLPLMLAALPCLLGLTHAGLLEQAAIVTEAIGDPPTASDVFPPGPPRSSERSEPG